LPPTIALFCNNRRSCTLHIEGAFVVPDVDDLPAIDDEVREVIFEHPGRRRGFNREHGHTREHRARIPPAVQRYLTGGYVGIIDREHQDAIDISLQLLSCPCRKSNPSVLVMQAAENRSRLDASY